MVALPPERLSAAANVRQDTLVPTVRSLLLALSAAEVVQERSIARTRALPPVELARANVFARIHGRACCVKQPKWNRVIWSRVKIQASVASAALRTPPSNVTARRLATREPRAN